MDILSTEVFESPNVDAQGRREVREKYVLSDGTELEYFWLGTQDISLVVEVRKEAILGELARKEAAKALVGEVKLPLSKIEFRRLFTLQERMAIDAFNASADSNPALSAEVKNAVRTLLEDLDSAAGVSLSHPDTVAGVTLYKDLGLITPERLQEILNG